MPDDHLKVSEQYLVGSGNYIGGFAGVSQNGI
jgi:hypothetical protein